MNSLIVLGVISYLSSILMGLYFITLHIKWRFHVIAYSKWQLFLNMFYLILCITTDNKIILSSILLYLTLLIFGHIFLFSEVHSKLLLEKLHEIIFGQLLITLFLIGYLIHRGVL